MRYRNITPCFAPYYAENYIKKEGKGTFERLRFVRKKNLFFEDEKNRETNWIRSAIQWFRHWLLTVEDCSLFVWNPVQTLDGVIDNVIIVKKGWIECYYIKYESKKEKRRWGYLGMLSWTFRLRSGMGAFANMIDVHDIEKFVRTLVEWRNVKNRFTLIAWIKWFWLSLDKLDTHCAFRKEE